MPDKFRILLVYPNIPMMLVTPLSIAAFTWILRQEGFEVELFEATKYWDGELSSPQNRVKFLQARDVFARENLELLDSSAMEVSFREKIKLFKPDLMLYSFTEDMLSRTLQLLRISNTFNIPTVVGGVLATAATEWLISFPEINMIGTGEGEEVVRDIALRISKGQELLNVPNLWIKLADGSVKRNAIRPYVNLDNYSTDFSLFEESRFIRPMGGKLHRALPIETFRGCPNQCTYCNSPMHKKIGKELHRVFLRRRSIEGIRKEIEHLVKDYKVNLLYIVDDSFLQRPKSEVEEFIEMYKDFRIPFWCNTRAESVSLDILEKLKEVGLFRVSFGIESGNEEFRMKQLKRNISNQKLLSYFNIIDESGIQYSINCIIGFPLETREMVFDTIRFVKQIKGYDTITVSIFTPYRGTVLREDAIKAGWLDPDALTVHTTASSMLDMPYFTRKQIDGLMKTFPLYVEFDETVWPEIEKAERSEPEGDEIYERYSSIYKERRWGQ